MKYIILSILSCSLLFWGVPALATTINSGSNLTVIDGSETWDCQDVYISRSDSFSGRNEGSLAGPCKKKSSQ